MARDYIVEYPAGHYCILNEDIDMNIGRCIQCEFNFSHDIPIQARTLNHITDTYNLPIIASTCKMEGYTGENEESYKKFIAYILELYNK